MKLQRFISALAIVAAFVLSAVVFALPKSPPQTRAEIKQSKSVNASPAQNVVKAASAASFADYRLTAQRADEQGAGTSSNDSVRLTKQTDKFDFERAVYPSPPERRFNGFGSDCSARAKI